MRGMRSVYSVGERRPLLLGPTAQEVWWVDPPARYPNRTFTRTWARVVVMVCWVYGLLGS